MLFLVRSALCIGIVASMLPNEGGTAGLGDVAASAGTAASAQLRSYCQQSGRCARAGISLARELLERDAAPAAPILGRPATDRAGTAQLEPRPRRPQRAQHG